MHRSAQVLDTLLFEKLQQSSNEIKSVVQYLDGDGRFATLTDGHYQDKFAVIKSERRIFTMVASYDVLKVSVRYYKGIYVMLGWEVLQSGLTGAIGKPISATKEGLPDQKLDTFPYYAKKLDLAIPDIHNDNADDLEMMILEQELADKGLMKNERPLDDVANYTPINQLKFGSRSWTIIGRVEAVLKPKIYTYMGDQEKELFNCIVFDESSKIQMTFFDQSCQKFKDKLQEGRVYKFRGGDVKSNTQYSLVDCKVSINFGREADITAISENTNIPMQYTADLVTIESLEQVKDKEIVSILGVVEYMSDLDTNSKLRRIRLYDESKTSIETKFWSSNASNNMTEIQRTLSIGSVAIFLNMKIKIQGSSKTLESLESTRILSDIPSDLERAHQAAKLNRRISNGERFQIKHLTIASNNSYPIKTIAQINEAVQVMLDTGADIEQKLFFECHAHISQISSHSVYYDACPLEKCQKKVSENQDGKIECPNCGPYLAGVIPKAKFRGVVELVDHTGSLEVMFNKDDAGKSFMGDDADKIRHLKIHDESAYETWLRKRQFRYFIVGIYPKINNFKQKRVLQFHVTYSHEFGELPERIKQTNAKLLTAIRSVKSELLVKHEGANLRKLKELASKQKTSTQMSHPLGTGHSSHSNPKPFPYNPPPRVSHQPHPQSHHDHDTSRDHDSEDMSRYQHSMSHHRVRQSDNTAQHRPAITRQTLMPASRIESQATPRPTDRIAYRQADDRPRAKPASDWEGLFD